MMLFNRLLFALSLLWCLPALASPEQDEINQTQVLAYTLGPLKIDRLMGAMHGPVLAQTMSPTPNGDAVWIKSFQVEVLNGLSRPDDSLEFLCHAWLEMGEPMPDDERLLTVSQGMAEMRLPTGYGIKLDDLVQAKMSAQALNDNNAPESNVSYRITIKYVPDDAAQKLGLQNLRTITAAIKAEDTLAPFLAAATVGDKTNKICAGKGVSFLVPPGRHEYKTTLRAEHPLNHGGVIHAIKLHMHAYGVSMSLVDETTGKVLWHGTAKNAAHKALITHVDEYSSATGITLIPNHRHAVKAVYDNKTKESAEAMAVLRIYVADSPK